MELVKTAFHIAINMWLCWSLTRNYKSNFLLIMNIQKKKIFDVCVIGSGAAGGFMAKELTAAGAEVILLEAGGRGKIGEDEEGGSSVLTADEIRQRANFWSEASAYRLRR